jgi:hypothetical protein
MAIIDKPSDYFNTSFTGTGATNLLQELDFQPDFSLD